MKFSPGHLNFFPPRVLTYLLHTFRLAERLHLCATSLLCVQRALLGCKFPETETRTCPSFIPPISNYQRKGGPECVNGWLFKNRVKEDSPLALFASKGKTGEILDKEHVRDFSTGNNIWLGCCLSGCSSSTWEVSITIFKLFTGFPITRWLLVYFLLSLVLLCPRMPKQRCREGRPGRRKLK